MINKTAIAMKELGVIYKLSWKWMRKHWFITSVVTVGPYLFALCYIYRQDAIKMLEKIYKHAGGSIEKFVDHIKNMLPEDCDIEEDDELFNGDAYDGGYDSEDVDLD